MMSWFRDSAGESGEGAAATPASREVLVELLLSSYADLQRRLTARLSSVELASEALQDTYIQLRRIDALGEIRNPRSYLFRMALNIARNRQRADARLLSATEIDTLLDMPDEGPDPERAVDARFQLAAVARALDQLPPRRRQIFRRAWVEGRSHEAIAVEFGIAIRTVRHELQIATEHLHNATKEKSVAELQFRLAKVSSW